MATRRWESCPHPFIGGKVMEWESIMALIMWIIGNTIIWFVPPKYDKTRILGGIIFHIGVGMILMNIIMRYKYLVIDIW